MAQSNESDCKEGTGYPNLCEVLEPRENRLQQKQQEKIMSLREGVVIVTLTLSFQRFSTVVLLTLAIGTLC